MADDARDVVAQRPRISEADAPQKAAQELNSALDTLRQEGEAVKEQLEKSWESNIKFFEGDHWTQMRPEGLTTMTINQMLRISIQQSALLSDTRPVYTIKAHREQENPIAGMLEAAAQAIWLNRGSELLIPRASMDTDVFGKMFWKTIWRPELYRGLGEVSVERVDPGEVIVDDQDSLEDCTFICHRQVKPVWWAKQRFPLVANQIVPDDGVSTFSKVGSREHLMRFPRPRNLALGERSGIERVIIEEWLIRDPSYMDEIPGTGQGVQNLPKYPAGRLITRIGEAGKVIAQDTGYPWYDWWPGPWVEASAPKIRGFWPIPPYNHMRVLQEALNLVSSLGMDQARNMTQGIWVVDEGAMRPEAIEQLRTMTAGVVTVKPGHKAERVPGPGISEGLLEYIRFLNQALEFVAGLMDTSYGKVPRGVTAGAAIEALQQAGQAMIRLRSREMEKALRDVGWKIIARVLQYYTDKRMMMVTGVDGRLRDTLFDPGVKKDSDEEILRWLTLSVNTTTEMALSKDKSYAMHAALYGMGAIDRKALLDAVEYPNRNEILQRMEAAEQLGIFRAGAGPTPRGRGVKIVEKMMGG